MKTDLSLAIDEIGEAIHENKRAKGWQITTPESWDDANQIPADLALVHSEVSEALESFRRCDLQGFSEELADVAIRLVGLAHGLRIDLGAAILAKIKKNQSRPHRHGGKKL